MNPFMHQNCCAKEFFSKIIVLEGIFLAQKRISQKLAGFWKSWRSMTPPKIEKYLGFNFYNFLKCWLVYEKITISHFFGHFSNVISLANIDFWEKSFCTVVSIYKCFNLTRWTHTSEIHQPTLLYKCSEVWKLTGRKQRKTYTAWICL